MSIPCLNESASIARVIREIRNRNWEFHLDVLVVDDGSTDATAVAAHEAGASVISHPRNLGLSAAFETAVNYCLSGGYDALVTIDGDGQFDSNEIDLLMRPIRGGKADFVSGSRFLDSSRPPQGIPYMKLWGNRQMARLISYLTRQSFKDVSCGFRAYSRKSLLHLNLMGGFTYTQESFLDLSSKGISICEVPVTVKYFIDRKSRMASSLVKYAFRTSKIIFRTFRDQQPFRFFLLFASAFLVPASLLGAFFLFHFWTTGRFTGQLWAGLTSGFLFGIGFLFVLLGIVVDVLTRIRRNQERLLFLAKSSYYRERNE